MKITEILGRLEVMERNARQQSVGPSVGPNNEMALKLAREIIESAATNALLPNRRGVASTQQIEESTIPSAKDATKWCSERRDSAPPADLKLEIAAKALVDYCWPQGKWRGHHEMYNFIGYALAVSRSIPTKRA